MKHLKRYRIIKTDRNGKASVYGTWAEKEKAERKLGFMNSWETEMREGNTYRLEDQDQEEIQ